MNRVTRITIYQAAARLGVTHTKLASFLKANKIKTYRGGGSSRMVEYPQIKQLWKESA